MDFPLCVRKDAAWTLRCAWTVCGRPRGRCSGVAVDVQLGAHVDVALASSGRWGGRSRGRCAGAPMCVRVGVAPRPWSRVARKWRGRSRWHSRCVASALVSAAALKVGGRANGRSPSSPARVANVARGRPATEKLGTLTKTTNASSSKFNVHNMSTNVHNTVPSVHNVPGNVHGTSTARFRVYCQKT